ncbi:glycerate dehydrogenase [Formivibrio citricus]|uniref:Glycerate dehydrogenase n=1 Tax=Formivibrio citricus TaxID=83765 RepID=A0A1I4XUH9_9NEIS|nr:D-2-hydroxyacid dehydrogenase [Formivibrio citricus]SFN29548.1 glycerate dehydrogenase [Formivibrio citricus]
MQPQIVFLDRSTLTVPLRPVNLPHRWVEYAATLPEETAARLQDATVAIVNKVEITEDVLRQAPQLKLVAVSATGYNNVNIAACKARGITVCNVRNYAVAGVPEHALMMMLALKRQLLAYRADLQAGAWQKAAGFCLLDHPLHDLNGSTLTLIGSGALGQAMARIGAALGMNVIFAEHKGTATARLGYVPFEEALARADVLSLHCPLNQDTAGLIGKRELALMKPDAVLINTGRGGIVDETALVEALQAGKLGGAGVDVLTEEPPRNGNPLLDVTLPNLIVTPHVAWASMETVQQLADQLIGNVEAFLCGNPRNVVV